MPKDLQIYLKLHLGFFGAFDRIVFYRVDPGACRVLDLFRQALDSEQLNTDVIAEGWGLAQEIQNGISENRLRWEELARVAAHRNVLVVMGAQSSFRRSYEVIDWCRLHGVASLFLFDSWKNFRLNFVNQEDGHIHVPDRIAVMDDYARGRLLEAVRDVVPDIGKRTDVIGPLALQRSLAYMGGLAPDSVGALQRRYNPQNKRLDLFLSEPIRKDFFETNRKDPGYDENRVLSYYIDHCYRAESRLLIKAHPRQDAAEIQEAIEAVCPVWSEIDCMIVDDTPVEDLIAIADRVFGITSVALNLALMAGKPVFSLQIGRNLFGRSLSHPDLEPFVTE